MSEQKLYKPKTCTDCPAVEKNKEDIICGCMRTLKAKITDPMGKLIMWKKCPLAWGKEE